MSFDSDVFRRIDALSKKVLDNKLLDSARAAMNAFLKEYAVTDEKKGELYVAFESQIAATMLQTIFSAALEMPIKQKQVEAAEKDIELKSAQIAYTNSQKAAIDSERLIKEAQSEKDIELKSAQIAYTNSQKAAIDSEKLIKEAQSENDTLLKSAQKAYIDSQKAAIDSEKLIKETQSEKDIELKSAQIAYTNSQKAAIDSERLIKETQSENDTAVKTAQAALLGEQSTSERYRRQDIQAAVALKNQQAVSVWESALLDAQRRKMLIVAESSNSAINKAKVSADFLQAIASRVDPTTADISYVKTVIDSINTTPTADTAQTEVGPRPAAIPTIPL